MSRKKIKMGFGMEMKKKKEQELPPNNPTFWKSIFEKSNIRPQSNDTKSLVK